MSGYKEYTEIFTDGSKTMEGVGAALVTQNFVKNTNYHLKVQSTQQKYMQYSELWNISITLEYPGKNISY